LFGVGLGFGVVERKAGGGVWCGAEDGAWKWRSLSDSDLCSLSCCSMKCVFC
jgi:hypothetical protein